MTVIDPKVGPLRVEREFDAPAQAVFDAWTNPEVMKRWLHADPGWSSVRIPRSRNRQPRAPWSRDRRPR